MTTDSEIVRRSLEEDPTTFGVLFDRHAAAVHRFVARRTDPGVADDVVAQLFLVAFERRSGFDRTRESAAPWLYGIATNLLRRHRRAEARMLRALARAPFDDATPDHGGDVDDRLDAARSLVGLAEALRSLSPPQRDALLLLAWADLTYEQIAEATGVPVGTVRSRISRARAVLREAVPVPTPDPTLRRN